MEEQQHKAGFVNILGKPNVGKSTLMNALVGERLAIITSKAQTTRHRILGIVNGEHFQIVYSDTPGIINPKYKMQEAMMRFVHISLQDADVILFMVEANSKADEVEDALQLLQSTEASVLLLLNKTDLLTKEETLQQLAYWQQQVNAAAYLPVSALKKINLHALFDKILELLPYSPPYYDKEDLTDRPERFFVAEIIREKILLTYSEEIPYSVEIQVEEFKEKPDITYIRANIFTNRASQKPILIGKDGKKLKTVGTKARADIEQFLQKKVYLELFVKVKENWRDDDRFLRNRGYE
ncbi:GTPase Era [Sphingobacteriales bacterium UPWRP_1]|nr:GTPase Era [Sphingobacteriales bacterium TSM_CSM]PSJ77063.1 GTPase Era [Sphingobacteriales bacterium UPWRP_1]